MRAGTSAIKYDKPTAGWVFNIVARKGGAEEYARILHERKHGKPVTTSILDEILVTSPLSPAVAAGKAETAKEPAAPEAAAAAEETAVDHSVNHYEGKLKKYIKLNRGRG